MDLRFCRRVSLATLMSSLLFVGLAGRGFGFEDAKVLPKGVRNINIRTVNTNIEQKSDSDGNPKPLAEPLMQDLTFDKMAKGETALNDKSLRAFLTSNGFNDADAVGTYTADLKGNLAVSAAVMSYGITSDITLGVAVPYYRASTSLAVGFKPNATGQAFLDSLAKPENNQTAKAREAGLKLNDAVGQLNLKLRKNGYDELDDWNARGFGDMTIAAKTRFFDQDGVGMATTTGVVAPTGRIDDPDNLTDIAFGDGQWDAFAQLSVDEALGFGFNVNQFAKYTAQLSGTKTIRAVTADEQIEVEKVKARFKLGDKFDSGVSLQFQAQNGALVGVGGTYFKKGADLYRDVDPAVKAKLETDTEEMAVNSEFQFGFSTVDMYLSKRFEIPFDVRMTYTKQAISKNMPITDLAQFDLNLYF